MGHSLLYVKATLVWGYSIRAPSTSSAQPSLLVPPPSTLVGALARGLASVLGWPERLQDGRSGAVYILDFVCSAHCGFSPEGYVSGLWSDISRVSSTPYLEEKYRGEAERSFGVYAVGKVYAPNCKLKLCYVIRNNAARRVLGEDWNSSLLKGAFAMRAIGSKEGLITIDDAELKPVNFIKESGEVGTSYFFPFDAMISCFPGPADLFTLNFWDFSKESPHWGRAKVSPQNIRYLVPLQRSWLSPTSVRVKLNEKGIALASSEGDAQHSESVVLMRSWL